ncbi:unnamed protein product [Didymodactylos carnosus]|uniref:Glycosyltransferase 61 catalytic domain-containing protein n=1 Tax=Didymodactylos carnosus TaxID=1234261 RepID=A0A814JYJ4_9BILA|nr:unnamed protein product [Didymodactylos carnosus]CAF1045391.1 unnamed protein product [Didymodactylos carnosus]CAF3531826.1 unnamed protein product [Didymodactylos carnosus]CAF3815315.1 unnamed protein product [Didymodactylos carnosus]
MNNVHAFIDTVRDMPAVGNNYHQDSLNISKTVSFQGMKPWLVHYRVTHLFDYRWFETGAYEWHLQRLNALNNNNKLIIESKIKIHVDDILTYINHHPEQGVVIDSAQHLFNPLFHSLPETGSLLDYTCTKMQLTENYLPCKTKRPEIISLLTSTTTYTLIVGIYDVFIDKCGTISTQIAQFLKQDCSNSDTTAETIHYNELIHVVGMHMTNPAYFVAHFLPKIIRLLAVTPETALLLLPLNVQIIREYVDLLVNRGLLDKNRTRLVNYESNKFYHVDVVYYFDDAPSTLSANSHYHRSNMQLLHRTLSDDLVMKSRDLIIVIKSRAKMASNYNSLIQIIHQLVLPDDLNYLQVHEFIANEGNVNEHIRQFQRARIVIGIHSEELVNIVYCKPGTHLVEIGYEHMSDMYFKIATHSDHKYWLAIGHGETSETIHVDIDDFRNILVKLYNEIDVG